MVFGPCYDFTIWSSLPPSTAASNDQTTNLFSIQRFSGTDSEDLKHRLSQEEQLKCLRSSVVNIMQIEKHTSAVAEGLETIFPGFPHKLLQKVVDNASTGQSVSVIPRSYRHSAGFYCLLNRPFFFPSGTVSQDMRTRFAFLPIATWVCPSPMVPSSHEKVSVLLICTDPAVGMLLGSHYSAAYDKDGGVFWNVTKRNLVEYHHQIHELSSAKSLLDMTKALHDEIAKVLLVREQLRVHSSALTRFIRLDDVVGVQALAERAQEHFEDIAYHEETSQVILRQLENMTSLAFNIETMTQGQAAARLNVLAFAFLPISWVASIFGMTQFSISAAWYPLWAFTVLVVVVSVPLAFPVNGIYRYILGLSAPHGMRRIGLGVSAKADPNALLQEPQSTARRPALWSDYESASNENSATILSSYSQANEEEGKEEGEGEEEGSKNGESSRGQTIHDLLPPKLAVSSRFKKFFPKREKPTSLTVSPPPVLSLGRVIPAVVDSNRSDRDVGAAFSPAPEDSGSHQDRGRWVNYRPMFASLHSPIVMTSEPISGSAWNTYGDQRPCKTFEVTAAEQSPMDDHAISRQARFKEQKDGNSGLVDIEAQRSNSSS